MGNINDRLNKVLETLNNRNISSVAFKEFVRVTPIRTGNARRSTRLSGNTINADYPYAQQLEDGKSNQAPNGMTPPTIEFVRAYVKQKLGIALK